MAMTVTRPLMGGGLCRRVKPRSSSSRFAARYWACTTLRVCAKTRVEIPHPAVVPAELLLECCPRDEAGDVGATRRRRCASHAYTSRPMAEFERAAMARSSRGTACFCKLVK